MKHIGRNDLCWCQSGKKYKKCHLRSDERGETLAPGVAKAMQPTVLAGEVSPRQEVPAHITPPEYSKSGVPSPRKLSCRKVNKDQVDRIRQAGKIARLVLDTVLKEVRPGITTDYLDKVAHKRTIELGAYPSPLNYMGFPKSICTSINEVVVHGIPDDRVLVSGDIINCDVTVFAHGMHGDCSETVFVGEVSPAAQKLVRTTWECLMLAIDLVKPGHKVNCIGLAIEAHARSNGFSVVREFTGHGIGECFHMAPYVAHFYEETNETLIAEGMTFTIEPMINAGSPNCIIWPDKWTAVTADLSLSAQFEHTVLVTSDGVEILTGTREPYFMKT